MAIFNSYVKLPEGKSLWKNVNMDSQSIHLLLENKQAGARFDTEHAEHRPIAQRISVAGFVWK